MKKDTNKKKKRRLLIALLMIMFTGVILGLSTYAWFTANQTVTVEHIDVNVAASNGLQISVDGVNWKTTVTNSEIRNATATYPGAVNQLPLDTNSMVPVSTGLDLSSSTGFMDMYKGEIQYNASDEAILVAEKTTETHGTTGDFVAFDLFFQVTTQTQIYLTSSSNVQALNTSTGIENAARVAFTMQGNAAAGSALSTIQALKAASNTGNNVFLWEPNYDVHTAAAVTNASVVYGQTTTQTGGSLLSYHGVKAPITTGDDIKLNSSNASFFTAMTPNITTKAAGIPTTAYEQAFTLEPGISKVRLYMWVEGQDVDCENNASGGSLSYNLQFSTLNQAG